MMQKRERMSKSSIKRKRRSGDPLVARNLRTALERRGRTAYSVANALGHPSNWLYQVVHEKSGLLIPSLRKIAEELGISVSCPASTIIAGLASISIAGSPPRPGPVAKADGIPAAAALQPASAGEKGAQKAAPPWLRPPAHDSYPAGGAWSVWCGRTADGYSELGKSLSYRWLR